ncbi:MAG: hypothetical protein H0T58_02765 [Gemmatimonadales bacterium]|nr:hypothetical protein [Gemmatimonadales bacterium]
MDRSDRIRRWAGWLCLGMVATLTSMGYHFGNIRFAPLAAGFAILAALCLVERRRAPMRSDGIHPRRDSGINRASR